MGVVYEVAKIGETMETDGLEILSWNRVLDGCGYAGGDHGFVAGGIQLVVEERDIDVWILDVESERFAGRVVAVEALLIRLFRCKWIQMDLPKRM